MAWPGVAVDWPSVFVIERSAGIGNMFTLMQLLPTTLWPSGLVIVTSLRPLPVTVTFRVTDVGPLKVTLLTVTPPLTLACKRFGDPGPPVSGPGSKDSAPAAEVPVIV